MMPRERFYLVCYDIVEDKRRNRVAQLLKDYGVRVQKSVFECRLDPQRRHRMADQLQRIIDAATDTVSIYLLCRSCVREKRILGLEIVGLEKECDIL